MDFLTFKTFISTEVLIAFYYFGAVVFPIGLWFFISWLLKRYEFLNITYNRSKALFWQALTGKQQFAMISTFVVSVFFMELFWRMLFEFLIAYMQIRDALVSS